MTILLVRHARAGDRSSWRSDDRLRPLDKRGRHQAEALVALLAPFDAVRVLSSPATRCTQTIGPLARHLGLEVEEIDALGEGNSKEAIRLVRCLVEEPTMILCSHGDVVPDVLDALSADGMSGWIGVERSQKASVWVLDTKRGRFTTARYLPPPPDGDGGRNAVRSLPSSRCGSPR